MADPILVFASFQPKPGLEADVREILNDMIGPTRAEPGNVRYDLYLGQKQGGVPQSYHLFEQYKDQAALEAHRQSDHYKAYRARIADYLAEPVGVQLLSIIDAAGSDT